MRDTLNDKLGAYLWEGRLHSALWLRLSWREVGRRSQSVWSHQFLDQKENNYNILYCTLSKQRDTQSSHQGRTPTKLYSLLPSYLQASQSALTPLWLLRANSKSTDLTPNFDHEEKHTFQCSSSSGHSWSRLGNS